MRPSSCVAQLLAIIIGGPVQHRVDYPLIFFNPDMYRVAHRAASAPRAVATSTACMTNPDVYMAARTRLRHSATISAERGLGEDGKETYIFLLSSQRIAPSGVLREPVGQTDNFADTSLGRAGGARARVSRSIYRVCAAAL